MTESMKRLRDRLGIEPPAMHDAANAADASGAGADGQSGPFANAQESQYLRL